MPLWGVEMKLDTFAVPFTADRRMAYAAAYLEQCSYRQVEEVQAADFVLLPVPAKDYMLEGLDGKTVFLGGGSYPGTLDYCKNENFAEKNGILTAEGALWLAQNHLERALYRSRANRSGTLRAAAGPRCRCDRVLSQCPEQDPGAVYRCPAYGLFRPGAAGGL